MFILNKKNGNIQECNNEDAIKVCQKDADHYSVAATRKELEGKAANKPQEGHKKSEAKNTKEPEKAAPEDTEKVAEGKEEQQPAGTGDGEKAGTGEEEQAGAGEEKTGQGGEDPLNGAGDERLAELNGKKVDELRKIAKGMGIHGYANMNKDTLVAMIMNY